VLEIEAKPLNEPLFGGTKKEEELMEFIRPFLAPLGLDLVHIEILHQPKKLRIFIDLITPSSDHTGITIDDCADASRALDSPLDESPLIESIFKGAYDLEVSSPGLDRPLRRKSDYQKFLNYKIKLQVFRPLSAQELSNEDYQKTHSKQKNFVGILREVFADDIKLEVERGPAKKKTKGQTELRSVDEIRIPLSLITKANLDPQFEDSALRKEIKQ
tara:strand:+ start:4074 stop:4721 length:648 start_codon:yes stop_codon:yes gene_type:complete